MRILTAGLLALLLAGCGAAKPVPEDRFYRLGEMAPEALAEPAVAAPVTVGLFRSDGLHSERAMLFSDDAQGLVLRQHHYHFWLDSPQRMLQDRLVRWLRAARFAPLVTAGQSPAEGLFVSGRIRRFERVPVADGWRVAIDLEIQIRDAGKRTPAFVRDYRVSVPAQGDSVEDSVRAFTEGVRRIFAQFAADAPGAGRIAAEAPGS